MLYRIAPGKGDAKIVEIGDGETVFLALPAADLKAAHKLLKQANVDGWESLKAPEKAA